MEPVYNVNPLALSATHWALERAGILLPPLMIISVDVPENLTIIEAFTASLKVSWDSVEDAIGYELRYRSNEIIYS